MTGPAEIEAPLKGLVRSVLGDGDYSVFYDLLPILAQDVADSEDRLKASLPASYPFLEEAASYATDSGGKRVRPLLISAVYRALGATETSKIQPLAAAFQLIHTATLVHDDVIDRADLRRGKPSVPRAFGMPAAIVAGDYLFVRAFQLAARYSPEVILRCGEACAELAQGEMMQENSRYDLTLGRDRYLRIMSMKTASIVAAGVASSAMVSGAAREVVDGLEEYGRGVGVAFQIQDDLLDVYGDPDVTGKPLFSDWKEGMPTLLSLDAHAALDGKERSEFERLFLARRKRPAELLRLKELTDRTDAHARSMADAEKWVESAIHGLRKLPEGPYRQLLEQVARGVITRRF
ncbi:MAG: polyprenyl synthetase family protein [Euryarchaeota archaeon]|nr:polyprenyl synthetase family protein [Euryarchaeota archaeon]MDE1880074.1 polyprenyl synthetase family protein [Euryarchaeota archaeon]